MATTSTNRPLSNSRRTGFIDVELADSRATDKWRTGFSSPEPPIIVTVRQKSARAQGLQVFKRLTMHACAAGIGTGRQSELSTSALVRMVAPFPGYVSNHVPRAIAGVPAR